MLSVREPCAGIVDDCPRPRGLAVCRERFFNCSLEIRRVSVLGVERQRLIDVAQRQHQFACLLAGGLKTLRRAANELSDLSFEAFSSFGRRLTLGGLPKLFRERGG